MKKALHVLLIAILVVSSCAVATASPGTRADQSDVVVFDWPAGRVQRDIIAHTASSLLPIVSFPARPTLEERLARPPFVTGEGRIGLDLSSLSASAAVALRTAAAGGRLNFGTFAPVGETLYGPARAPKRLVELYRTAGLLQGPDWVSVDLASALTRGARRIWFNARIVLEGSVAALETGTAPIYPPGTWFVAEQFHADGSLMETHLVGKRADRDWDFLMYDAQGNQATSSAELGMRAPTTCFACHRNMGRMPPFRDFPAASAPIDGFQPAVQLALDATGRAVASRFALAGPRPDELHGIYGGVAALRARTWMQSGTAPAWLTALWPRLVRVVPELATFARSKLDPDAIAALKRAHDQWHGTGGLPAARATLVALAAKLSAAPSVANTWTRERTLVIVKFIDAGQSHDGEHALHELIEIVSRPALTKPALKKAGNGFHELLHAGGPDAARKCEAAIRAYVDQLRPDTSALSVWGQRRLDDVLGAFAAGQTAAAEERLHAMLAAL